MLSQKRKIEKISTDVAETAEIAATMKMEADIAVGMAATAAGMVQKTNAEYMAAMEAVKAVKDAAAKAIEKATADAEKAIADAVEKAAACKDAVQKAVDEKTAKKAKAMAAANAAATAAEAAKDAASKAFEFFINMCNKQDDCFHLKQYVKTL